MLGVVDLQVPGLVGAVRSNQQWQVDVWPCSTPTSCRSFGSGEEVADDLWMVVASAGYEFAALPSGACRVDYYYSLLIIMIHSYL